MKRSALLEVLTLIVISGEHSVTRLRSFVTLHDRLISDDASNDWV